ncbi:ATP-dependent helicase HrpB [Kocuria sp.]|uniref:ATP-dependent helicase HrpB n=1 Tax=Kocuria sp. TaxID=1871328 RepID=UPI0026E0405A|nr:ATP-dependent helicase HrpB [Kocuria sp.]MDO5617481.1 ATP-dependent helicase HrpB [Kocuria sp.]
MPALPFDLNSIGAGLPIADLATQVADALNQGSAVIQAPPGSGKTTFIPPLVANLLAATVSTPAHTNNPTTPPHADSTPTSPKRGDREVGAGRVVVTQPRRVAARAAASRLARLTNTRVGEVAGFSVRGQRTLGPDASVEFVTPGILLRRLLKDPELRGVGAVVLDEVHERGLDTDLLTGMLAEVRQLREDLPVMAMSATVDAPLFAGLLPTDAGAPAPIVDSPAVVHPLDIEWKPAEQPRLDDSGVTRTFLRHIADVAAREHARALAADPTTDALVFVPGAWEVARVAEHLRHLHGADIGGEPHAQGASGALPAVEVLELHGRIHPREQDRAVSGRLPGEPARVVVTTSLAESSLTVPGVRLVIDSGLAREPRRDTVRGMTGLVTVAASRASADQRAGRAARLGPGRAVRCYDERTWAAMPAHVTPEIATADLTAAALALAVWGAPGGSGLSLPTAPPERSMAQAQATLRTLGATDDADRATALGRRLADVPADPRLARALLVGAHLVDPRTAAEVVATLSSDQHAPGGDLTAVLRAVRSAPAWRAEVRRLANVVTTPTGPTAELSTTAELNTTAGLAEVVGTLTVRPEYHVGAVVALARPEWIARQDGNTYLFAGGTRAGLPSGSALQHHEWLAVADVARAQGRNAQGTGAVIRSAVALDQPTAETIATHLASDLVTNRVETNFAHGTITARQVHRLGAIILASTPVQPTPAQAQEAFRETLLRQGLSLLHFSTEAKQLRARLAAVHRHVGAPWPDMDDDALLANLETWLSPEIARLAQGVRPKDLDLKTALQRLLPWPEAARLEELAPTALPVPSGSRPRIDWEGDQPVVRVKLQECFGLAQSPLVLEGTVPVVFHLLSPAGRELAITSDLRSFWSGPYAQVRAEMRGRYPKHPWPEDPWSAPATARTKRR